MNLTELTQLYNFSGKTIVVTGGTGVLGGAMARGLAGCGADVIVLSRGAAPGSAPAADGSGTVTGLQADVLKADDLRQARDQILGKFSRIDGLINAAGGNQPAAMATPDRRFFDLPVEALRGVSDLNLLGTVLPCQVFGEVMARQGEGAILNITSMAALRPLTRVVAYGAAKAAVSNFTQWLAVHMAQEYSPRIRVNALAPGFYLGIQNRALLVDQKTGELTPRGKTIIGHTPMGRFGDPQDLLGAALWLLSPASAFVTGIVVPVDGGFSAFAGV